MKRDRFVSIAVPVTLVVAFAIWFLLRFGTDQAKQQTITPKQHLTTATKASSPPSQVAKSSRILSKSRTIEEERAEYTALNHRPIDFYGKAIDQFGSPVPEAEVIDDVMMQTPAQSGVSKFKLKTDALGRFEIKGYEGESLEVGVRKVPGFYNGRVDGQLGQGFLARYSLFYGDKIHKPDPSNPVIFKMWKLAGPEPMIEDRKFYGIVPDGREYTIDLVNGKKIEGKGDKGDLIVQVHRPQGANLKKSYDWNFEIRAIDGGIIETQDIFPYLAPESAYPSAYLHMADSTQPNWAKTIRKQFYIKSRAGKVHGRMQVEVFSDYQDGGVFRVEYYVNPSGSRNLEYDPKKRLTKDEIAKLGFGTTTNGQSP